MFDHFVELAPKELIIYFTINDNAEIAVDFGNDGFTGYTKIEKSHAWNKFFVHIKTLLTKQLLIIYRDWLR